MSEDNSKIVEELLNQVTMLTERLHKIESYDIEADSITGLAIEDLKDKLRITGILLAPGKHNDCNYSSEDIKEMFDRYKSELAKLELTVEHETTKEYQDEVIGQHESVEWDTLLNAIKYSAIVTNPQVIEDVKAGKLGATSMRLRLKKTFTENGWTGTDYKPINNTLTAFPACKACQIFNKQDLSQTKDGTTSTLSQSCINYYGIKEKDINSTETILNKEANQMSEEVIADLKELSIDIVFKCMKCGRTVPTGSLLSHYMSHLKGESKPGEEQPYPEPAPKPATPEPEETVCPKCKQKFPTYDAFIKHWNESHQEEYGGYGKAKEEMSVKELQELLAKKKCPNCGEPVDNLPEHIKTCKKPEEEEQSKKKKEEEYPPAPDGCSLSDWTDCIKGQTDAGKSMPEAIAVCKAKIKEGVKEKKGEETQKEEKREEMSQEPKPEAKPEVKQETPAPAPAPIVTPTNPTPAPVTTPEPAVVAETKVVTPEVKIIEPSKEPEKDLFTQISEAEGSMLDKTASLICYAERK